LVETAEFLLNNPDEAARESRQIVEGWDYGDVDFEGTLLQAVYG
jgi:hypothetical protein